MAAIDYVYMYVVQAICRSFTISTAQTIFVLSHMVAAFER